MSQTGDEPAGAPRRDRIADDGEPWDDGAWVDVDSSGRWHPTFEERSRATVVLAVLLGVALLVVAFASIDDGDGDRADVTTATSTTTTTEATTTTVAPPGEATIDGEPPPPGCEDDDRDARPLRERSDSTVLVLNGTPRGGHAGENTDDLEELGYSTMEPGNASIRPITTVDYVEGFCAEAVRLVFELAIEGATWQPVPEDSDVFVGRAGLVVTLGRDSL